MLPLIWHIGYDEIGMILVPVYLPGGIPLAANRTISMKHHPVLPCADEGILI